MSKWRPPTKLLNNSDLTSRSMQKLGIDYTKTENGSKLFNLVSHCFFPRPLPGFGNQRASSRDVKESIERFATRLHLIVETVGIDSIRRLGIVPVRYNVFFTWSADKIIDYVNNVCRIATEYIRGFVVEEVNQDVIRKSLSNLHIANQDDVMEWALDSEDVLALLTTSITFSIDSNVYINFEDFKDSVIKMYTLNLNHNTGAYQDMSLPIFPGSVSFFGSDGIEETIIPITKEKVEENIMMMKDEENYEHISQTSLSGRDCKSKCESGLRGCWCRTDEYTLWGRKFDWDYCHKSEC
jgi:hypothetical protein